MFVSSYGIVNDKIGYNLGGLVGCGENILICFVKVSGVVSGGVGIRVGGLVGFLEGW